MAQTCFLKLGGSLITDKDQAQTALLPQIDAIGEQITEFINTHPETRLLIGHGSGSFGHIAANRYQTRLGVHTSTEWRGFAEVWLAARALNQIIVERFASLGLPVISFPLSAGAVVHDGAAIGWNTAPIQAAIDHHLLPIVYGDVAFDDGLGGTILSTEEQFAALMPNLKAQSILLAGLEEGVWADFPACTSLISEITPASYQTKAAGISGSASIDVTGGMASKVRNMLWLIQHYTHLQVRIFSGKQDGAILSALRGENVGTLLHSDVQGG
jgi:isopentenyl phosphate kinase